ncbi:hypothetical protein WEU41_17515 [Pseudomonas fragi]|jgi:DNA-binding phage protein|uniref:hypothetical protein n=1 Tax=Pseudomonas fragi TaxID=296 RepID=UPI0026A6B83C
MSDTSKFNDSKTNEDAIETELLNDEERILLTLYREMSELDRRYIRRVAEVIAATSG